MNSANEHAYALDEHGAWVNASIAPLVKDAIYFCDCPLRHKLKHVKPSGVMGRRAFAAYFAHIASGFKRDMMEDSVMCGGGGESAQHRQAKHMLREHVNTVSFPTLECPRCHCRVLINLHDCTIRLEIRSTNGQWRYDCLAYNADDVPFYALEVVHTHYSDQKKVVATRQDGLGIAEFRTSDIMQLDESHRTILPNLLAESRICHSCMLLAMDKECLWFYQREQATLLTFEKLVHDTMLAMHRHVEFTRQLASMSLREQAFLIVEHYKERIIITSGLWGELGLTGYRRVTCGFYKEKGFLIVLFDSWWDGADGSTAHGKLRVWCDMHRICLHQMVAVKYSTIINQFRRMPVDDVGGRIQFKSCLYPILKRIEMLQCYCANCGKYGHSSEQICPLTQCARCSIRARYLH